jgi:hypothetical protein
MCSGHEDPLGDVHPRVRVENGNFVVYFGNNAEKPVPDTFTVEEGKYPPYYTIYKTILSRQGRVLAQREPSSNAAVPRASLRLQAQEQGLYVKEENGQWLVFPPWSRMHHGRPFMVRLTDGKRQVQQFDWDRNDVDIVLDAVEAGDDIVFLVSFQPSKSSLTTDQHPLYFYRFTKDGRRCSAPQKIGTQQWRVCSNIVVQSPRYMVSWLDGQRLILSTWDSSSGTLKSQVLQDPVDWNLSISAARIDNMMLIAYHEKGTIKTKMVDLNSPEG